jgi:hypothetical protein
LGDFHGGWCLKGKSYKEKIKALWGSCGELMEKRKRAGLALLQVSEQGRWRMVRAGSWMGP